MQFRYDPEHEALRTGLRRFFENAAEESETRQVMQSELGWDPTVLKRLADELGVFAMAIPVTYGGAGYGVLELGIACHEAGRSLVCAPLLSASLAAQILLASRDEAAATAYLPGIAAADIIVAIAAREPGADWDSTPQTVATEAADGWRLSGIKDWVIDGLAADQLIVSAQTESGPSLFAVDAGATGLDRTPIETVDATRRFAKLTLTDASATAIGTAGDARRVLDHVRDVALILLAAEQTGIAERCLRMATEYAKTREQFGRAIGSFQAIKHKLAAVQLELEAAISAVMFASWQADNDPAGVADVARIAAYAGSEAAMLATSENIQVHGGIGATWEHPAHLYLRRATMNRQLFGDPQQHLEELATSLAAAATTGPA